MSVEHRYDAVLRDMLTLLQEAVFRFLNHQEVDVAKFKHYFCNFNRMMTKIEQQFHSNQAKHSKSLKKLSELFLKPLPTKISLQPSPMKSVQPSETLSKPKFEELNVIGEEVEFVPEKQKRKRSGTAEGKRRNNFTIDFENGRPRTGVHRTSDRYNKTIENDVKEEKKDRKSFYDDLERQTHAQIIYENRVKVPKKRSISSHRWSFKINKLF